MGKLCVGIICGGPSLEHEISLNSANYIAKSIDKLRFDVVIFWIDKNGRWYVRSFGSDIVLFKVEYEHLFVLLDQYPHQFVVKIKGKNTLLKIDVFFPVVHGLLGEDGVLQGLLRMMNVPFVGSDVLGSAISMDKEVTKCLLRDSGILVVPFKSLLINDWNNLSFKNCVSEFGLPFFVKPVNQGSSIGVAKIIDYHTFCQALNVVFTISHKALIERAIIGRELGYAVLGNDELKISVCGEVIVKNDFFYTYGAKYISNNSHIIAPALVDSVILNEVRCIALRAFRVLNCIGMARIDFFLDLDNKIFINEINTLPGFAEKSMYVKLWQVTGLKSQDLITNLIELALDTYRKRNRIFH